MSIWFRTLLIGVAVAELASCSANTSPRQLVQDAATAMGGVDKLKSIQTISMTGGSGTRTKVGQAMTATGPDQIGQLSNDSEILDLANKRAAFTLCCSPATTTVSGLTAHSRASGVPVLNRRQFCRGRMYRLRDDEIAGLRSGDLQNIPAHEFALLRMADAVADTPANVSDELYP